MPRRLPGHAAEALAGVEPAELSARLAAIFRACCGEAELPSLEGRARQLIGALQRHHPGSAEHSIRVAELTHGMWRTAPEVLGPIGTALLGSLLHDVGKLSVPNQILASHGLLTEEERAVVSSHAACGAELLLAMGFPAAVAAVARGHHEHWSGGGYPTGLPAGNQPPVVRAVAVADAFDAMTDPHRAYRARLSRAEALREVAACAGTHFEPLSARILARSLARPGRDRRSRGPAPRFRAAPPPFPELAATG